MRITAKYIQIVLIIFLVFQNASAYLTEVRKRNNQVLARTSYAFDSIWAAALMLNATSNETRPEDFVFSSDKFADEYKDLLEKQEFEGLSVSYTVRASPRPSLTLAYTGCIKLNRFEIALNFAKQLLVSSF
jgi:hypothetical protein